MDELTLKIESKVISNNLQKFEKQANDYLASLSTKFETDEDFARAKEEVKELQEIEKRTRDALDAAINDSANVKTLIDSVNVIVERFRKARLERDKLVKSKEKEVKDTIANEQIESISDAYNCAKPVILAALKISMPLSEFIKRINETTKNKRSIDGLQKAVNAEAGIIVMELTQEVTRLTERYKELPQDKMQLFRDAPALIASDDDLAPIVAERLEINERLAKIEAERIAQKQAETPEEKPAEKMPEPVPALAEAPEGNDAQTYQIEFASDVELAKKIARTVQDKFGVKIKLRRVK